jgi:CheY-like chemotaxis protein
LRLDETIVSVNQPNAYPYQYHEFAIACSVASAERQTPNEQRQTERYTNVYWILAPLLSVSHVARPIRISIVDDDPSVREGLSRLLSSVGFAVNTSASAEEYLCSDQPGGANCLILDIRMSGMSGIELQRHLAANHREVPVIFITAHEEETERAQAPGGKARTVLIKPFSEEALLNAISKALTA